MITSNNIRSDVFVRRSPVFYGWVVWAVATLGFIATSPGQSYSVSLFFDFFIVDFGLDRTSASGLYGLGTFLASLSLTWVGRKIDHIGSRRMSVIVTALFAVALAAFSLVAGPIALLVGFIAIRGLGQGALGLVNSTVVPMWFKQRRGRVTSLMMIMMGLFQSAYIPWLQGLLNNYDWRTVWIMLGIAVAVTALPLSWLLMRDRPELFGLAPDGLAPLATHSATTETTTQIEVIEEDEDNWTLREAMGTVTFWVFLVARWLMPAWGTGLILHQVSLFAALGHDANTVAETYTIFALVMAGSALMFGYLVDRFRPGVVIAFQMTPMALSLILATSMTQGWMLLLYALSFGLAQGSGGVFDGAVWANLFGRKHLGEIRGFTTTSMVAGSAAGPVLFGMSYDLLGSYDPVLWVGAVWALVAVVAGVLVPKPRQRASKTD